jgi:hypothetical protein
MREDMARVIIEKIAKERREEQSFQNSGITPNFFDPIHQPYQESPVIVRKVPTNYR